MEEKIANNKNGKLAKAKAFFREHKSEIIDFAVEGAVIFITGFACGAVLGYRANRRYADGVWDGVKAGSRLLDTDNLMNIHTASSNNRDDVLNDPTAVRYMAENNLTPNDIVQASVCYNFELTRDALDNKIDANERISASDILKSDLFNKH